MYWPATRCDFINFDDPDYVPANAHVLTGLTPKNMVWAFTTGHASNWHPLTWWSLMLDASLFGKKPAGFHFTNVMLHSIAVALLFWLLWCLTGAKWRSAAVAALFAWHPAHVESVAWVAERKDVLSACFGFLTLLFYTYYARSRAPNSQGNLRSRSFYLASLLSFACGLMSKSMLVTWPFVLLLLDYWPLGRWDRGRKAALMLEKTPFVALAAAVSVTTFLVQQQEGAMVGVNVLPLVMRGENALLSYGRYLGKLLWPHDLAVFYPQRGFWPIGEVFAAGLLLVGVSVLCWQLRGRWPFLPVGWFWFVGTLTPVIGLVQVGTQSMADRYLYIPSVGIFVLVVWGAYEFSKHWCHQRVICGLAIATLLAAYWVVTRQQIRYWNNSETLFRHTLAVTQNNFLSYYNLGVALYDQGRWDEAAHQFEAVLTLQPMDAKAYNSLGVIAEKKGDTNAAFSRFREATEVQPQDAKAYNNLGILLEKEGRTNAAIEQFQEAIRRNPRDPEAYFRMGDCVANRGETDAAIGQFQNAIRAAPDFGVAHNMLAIAWTRKGQYDRAIGELQDTLRLTPDFAEAHKNLGIVFAQKGQMDAAVHEFQEAIRLTPSDADAHYNLGNALVFQGHQDAAIGEFQADLRLRPGDADARSKLDALLGRSDLSVSQYEEAMRRKPNDAIMRYNYANFLARNGQADEAITQYQEALRLQPDNAQVHNNLGDMLLKKGRTDDAIGEFEAAVRLQPEDADAHYNLGNALLKKGDLDETIHEFQAAIHLRSDYAPAHYNLGIALMKKSRLDEAITEFTEAIRLKPDYAIAHNSLGIALGGKGRLDEAIRQFEEAIRLQSDYTNAGKNLEKALVLKNGGKIR